MISFQVLPSGHKLDVDLPDSISHRSGGGSIFLIPGHNNEVTEEEMRHLLTEHAEYFDAHVHVLGDAELPAAAKPKPPSEDE